MVYCYQKEKIKPKRKEKTKERRTARIASLESQVRATRRCGTQSIKRRTVGKQDKLNERRSTRQAGMRVQVFHWYLPDLGKHNNNKAKTRRHKMEQQTIKNVLLFSYGLLTW